MTSKTNYSKMSTNDNVEVVIEQTPEVIKETPVVEAESKFKVGCVADCSKLNIRKDARLDAKIIGTLVKDETVHILDEVDEFYMIDYLSTVGYCMKKYISVNQ